MPTESTESGNERAVRPSRGILSERDRKYFHDALDVDSGSAHERMIRKDIRERLRHAILDFRLLQQHLREDDLARVMDELPTEALNNHPLSSVIAFVYLAVANQSRMDFEPIVRDGTQLGAERDGQIVKRLEFTLETNPVDIQELLDDLQSEAGITLSEFEHLLRSGVFPTTTSDTTEVSLHMTFDDPIEDQDDVRIRFERQRA